MDDLYDRTTKSDVMKSTFTAVLWFYDDEKLEERRREIRRNMTPGQRARFNSPISAQQRVLDELRTRGLAPAKKPRAPKPANDLDQANARIVELEEELKSARSIARLHQLRGLGDAKVLKSLGRSPKGRHYRG